MTSYILNAKSNRSAVTRLFGRCRQRCNQTPVNSSPDSTRSSRRLPTVSAGLWCWGIFILTLSAAYSDPFIDLVRKTEPLTPQEELRTFHLPPGFDIQLVASEPQIGKV